MEKLEAALVDGAAGSGAATPHRALATGDHQTTVQQLAGDLGDAGRRQAGQTGQIGTGQLLVLLQAGIDQAIVERRIKSILPFTISFIVPAADTEGGNFTYFGQSPRSAA
jgi:hypothetical protein